MTGKNRKSLPALVFVMKENEDEHDVPGVP